MHDCPGYSLSLDFSYGCVVLSNPLWSSSQENRGTWKCMKVTFCMCVRVCVCACVCLCVCVCVCFQVMILNGCIKYICSCIIHQMLETRLHLVIFIVITFLWKETHRDLLRDTLCNWQCSREVRHIWIQMLFKSARSLSVTNSTLNIYEGPVVVMLCEVLEQLEKALGSPYCLDRAAILRVFRETGVISNSRVEPS